MGTPAEVAIGVLAGLRAGRTAVSAGRDAPVALPVGGELVVIGADRTLLLDADGGRRAVAGDLVHLEPGAKGGHAVVDHDGGIVAIAGPVDGG